MRRRRLYYFTWVLVIALILFASVLLYISLTGHKQSYSMMLPLAAWLLVVASSVVLFIFASNWVIFQKDSKEQEKTAPSQHPPLKAVKRNIEDALDIQGIAKKVTRRLRIDSNPVRWGEQLLSSFVAELETMTGVFYYKNSSGIFRASATFALPQADDPYEFEEGVGLTGNVVKNKQVSVYRNIPDDYTDVYSGLGKAKPSYLAIIPILRNDEVIAVVELAGFKWADAPLEQLFQIISRDISEKLSSGNKANEVKDNNE